MNKGYIKVALALLSVAGYMQNITFASEHASTTIPLNVKYKQQLYSAPNQVTQQLHSAPRQVTQQLHSAPRQVTQQLHSAPRQVTQQLHSAPRQVTQQLYSAPRQVTQQLHSAPRQVTQQLHSAPRQVTQQLYSAPRQASQQLYSAPRQASQQLHFAPRQASQQLYSAPRQASQQLHFAPRQVTQQLYSAPRQVTQQLYSAPRQVTQQLYSDPDQDTQQLYSDPDQDTQQLPSAPNHDKHKAYFIPIGYKQEEYFNPIEFKRQLALKSKEAKFAEYIMDEALDIAKEHAIYTYDYNLYSDKNGVSLHFKRVYDTDIGRIEFTIPNPNSYNGVINMLWDPNGEKNFNMTFIGGSISRMYNKNLVIVQHRYKGIAWNRYYHAIANKVELSRDETAIVLVSSDMNDHSALTYKNYINSIVESANTFTPDIDSEEDIRSAKLNKFYINLIAFFIKREANGVKIIHLSSIDHDIVADDPEEALRNMTAHKMLNVVKLRDIFKKE
ncbi:fam-a protein [Plasmodium vinckei petteri]|uniref:Fam-a protein n=1 Tax=Plasmodium vinckei petteri TaxID=138298 RepID=A0A6V7SZP3_PLAVN|nr:fam-a protein [Plasmodium vinckei petteri]